MKLKNIIGSLVDKKTRFEALNARGFYKNLTDAEFLKKIFKIRMGYDLNLNEPKTFNEKLQWLKLYDRKPIYSKMVDKYEAKQYAASIIGQEYIIPTYGIWESFDEIPFDDLPDQFVLKCTHDSGGLVICRDKTKFDKRLAKTKIERSMKNNYFWRSREWPYKDVKPRIIAEKYMEDSTQTDDLDYRIFTNGKIRKALFLKEDTNDNNDKNTSIMTNVDIRNVPVYEYDSKNFEKKVLDVIHCLANDNKIRFAIYEINNASYLIDIKISDIDYLSDVKKKISNCDFAEYINFLEKNGGGEVFLDEGIVIWLHNNNIHSCLNVYKIFTFNGEPKIIQAIQNDKQPNETIDYYDCEWNRIHLKQNFPNSIISLAKPQNLEIMLSFAKKMGEGHKFLRVDLYEIENRVFFSEFTFYSDSGLEKFYPNDWDILLGKLIEVKPVKSIFGGYLLIDEISNSYILLSNKTSSATNKVINDYKIYTMNGTAKLCMINQGRGLHTTGDYFDKDFKWLDFSWGYDHASVCPCKPKYYNKMFELAEKLAIGTIQLRVDFYEVNNRIYFGELTFFDGGGLDPINPREWDYKLGEALHLPK